MKRKLFSAIGALALLGSAGCLAAYDPGAQATPQGKEGPQGPETATTVSSAPPAVRPLTPEEQTTAWLSATDAAALAARAAEEGPPEIAARRHACMKMKYATVGNLLASLGVDMGALPFDSFTDCRTMIPTGKVATRDFMPAKYVYCDGRLVLGLPQYEGRASEITSATTASATKLMDLFVTAAPEIIAKISTVPQCMVSGQGAVLFNADNTCNASGITCLQGYPASDDQVALCSRVVSQAVATPANTTLGVPAISEIDNGKRIAVAAILSAAHSCE